MAILKGRGYAAVNYPTGMNLGGDPTQALVHSTTTGNFVVSLSSVDLGQGLKVYEYEHRKLIAPKQNGFATAATLMVPATRFGVALRDNGARLVTGWQRLKAGAR